MPMAYFSPPLAYAMGIYMMRQGIATGTLHEKGKALLVLCSSCELHALCTTTNFARDVHSSVIYLWNVFSHQASEVVQGTFKQLLK